MPDLEADRKLQKDFGPVAAPHTPRRGILIDIDSDVLDWMEKEGTGSFTEEVNGLLRFYMESSQQKESEFASGAWDPGNTVPAPAL